MLLVSFLSHSAGQLLEGFITFLQLSTKFPPCFTLKMIDQRVRTDRAEGVGEVHWCGNMKAELTRQWLMNDNCLQTPSVYDVNAKKSLPHPAQRYNLSSNTVDKETDRASWDTDTEKKKKRVDIEMISWSLRPFSEDKSYWLIHSFIHSFLQQTLSTEGAIEKPTLQLSPFTPQRSQP